MSYISTKFHEILLTGFRGIPLTNCFSRIFNFGQISKFKRGIIPGNKNYIKISCGYAHVHSMSFITTSFTKFLWAERCCADQRKKKELTSRAHRRVKNIIPSATRFVGYHKTREIWWCLWKALKKNLNLFYTSDFVLFSCCFPPSLLIVMYCMIGLLISKKRALLKIYQCRVSPDTQVTVKVRGHLVLKCLHTRVHSYNVEIRDNKKSW